MRIREESPESDDDGSGAFSQVSWTVWKERARDAYERGDYPLALMHYATALQPEARCPSTERQLILSNMVATRLMMGGPGQAEAAVENAKQVSSLGHAIEDQYMVEFFLRVFILTLSHLHRGFAVYCVERTLGQGTCSIGIRLYRTGRTFQRCLQCSATCPAVGSSVSPGPGNVGSGTPPRSWRCGGDDDDDDDR